MRTSNLKRWLLKDVRLCVLAAGPWAGRVRAGDVCALGRVQVTRVEAPTKQGGLGRHISHQANLQ